MKAIKNNVCRLIISLITIVMLFSSASAAAKSHPGSRCVQTNQYDLDGNGKKDNITLKFEKHYFSDEYAKKCTVSINEKKIVIETDGYMTPNFLVVDIDTADNKKEIVLNYLDETIYYAVFIAYDGKTPLEVDTIRGTPKKLKTHYEDLIKDSDCIRFSGDGTFLSSQKSDLLQSWELVVKYAYVGYHIYPIKQNFYDAYKPNTVEVIQSFQVYTENSNGSKVHTLKKGEKIKLLGTDNFGWVKIQDARNNIYWIALRPRAEGFSSSIYTAGIPPYGEDIGAYKNNSNLYLKGLQVYG